MNGPDFVIAGGHKCATTSIHSMLDKHPDIQMSEPKEPHYFARRSLRNRIHKGIWSSRDYDALWSSPESLRGEASVLYLYFAEEVALSMLAECDEPPRIIVSVRNPIDRAFSSFCDVRLKNPDESATSFESAVRRETLGDTRSLAGPGSPTLHHLALGFYADGIETFRRLLGPDHVHLILFDDLRADPGQVMRGIEDFLGIRPSSIAHTESPRNRGGVRWRSDSFAHLTRSMNLLRARRALARKAPRLYGRLRSAALSRLTATEDGMSLDTREVLTSLYNDEVKALGRLFQRDLGFWLHDL